MKYLPLLALLFIGCSEPKVGDWYEEIKTGKRYKLESIDNGEWNWELYSSIYEKELKSKRNMFPDTSIVKHGKYLKDLAESKRSKTYYLEDYRHIAGDIIWSWGVTQKELEQDFRKIK